MGIFVNDAHESSVKHDRTPDPPEGQSMLAQLPASTAEPEPTPEPLDELDPSQGSGKCPGRVDASRKFMVIKSNWIAAIVGYLEHGILPTNELEVRRLVPRAKSNVVAGDHMYKRSTSGMLLKCSTKHGSICGHHAVPRSLVGKAF